MRAIDDGGGDRPGLKEGRREGSPAAADAAESCYYKTCTDIDISGGGDGLTFSHRVSLESMLAWYRSSNLY